MGSINILYNRLGKTKSFFPFCLIFGHLWCASIHLHRAGTRTHTPELWPIVLYRKHGTQWELYTRPVEKKWTKPWCFWKKPWHFLWPKTCGNRFHNCNVWYIYILYRYVCRIYLSSAIRRYETEMEHDALHGKIWPETADVAVSSGSGWLWALQWVAWLQMGRRKYTDYMWGWVKTCSYHIWGNKHPLTIYFEVGCQVFTRSHVWSCNFCIYNMYVPQKDRKGRSY